MTDKVVQIYAEASPEDRMHAAILAAIMDEQFDGMTLATTLGVLELVKMNISLESRDGGE